MKAEEKRAAIERLIHDFHWSAADPDCLEHQTLKALREIAGDLRAQTGTQIGVVRQALQFQTTIAKRHYAQHGCYAIGHAMTICEAMCGKWGRTIEKALEQFEREAVS